MRLSKSIVPVLALVGSALLASCRFGGEASLDQGQEVDAKSPFTLVELANRSFEGSPALALTVSQPLATKQNFEAAIQVFEMPGPDKPHDASVDQAEREQYEDEAPDAKASVDKAVSTDAKDVDVKGGKELKAAWVLGSNPRILFLPNVKPKVRYVVIVGTGLKDASGRNLASGQRYAITTAAVSPAYYFASKGMVLPAGQNGGLPVITVNVPEVDLQFLRVRQEQFPRFLDMVIAGAIQRKKTADGEEEEKPEWQKSYSERHHELHGAVGAWELDPLHAMTDSVYQGRFVTEQKPNKQSVTFIPVESIKELQEPGIYVAVMSQPGRFRGDYQTSYFYVSDMGLSLHNYAQGTTALVSSLTSGKAVSEVKVSWLDGSGKPLAQGQTDGEGRVDFAERPANARVVMAEKGKQVSLLALKEPALDLSEFDTSGDPYKPTRLFAYSGRDLYRPGESFEVAILARDADGKPVPAQTVQAILRRPDGRNQLVTTLKPRAAQPGYFQQRVDIPLDAPTGVWSLELRTDPADKVAGTVFHFSAEEFLPERMKLDLSAKAKALQGMDKLSIDVNGAYLYGAPAAGNSLLGTVEYLRALNPLQAQLPGYVFGSVDDDNVAARKELEASTLDDQGKAEVRIDTSPATARNSAINIRTTLSLLETGGRPVIRSLERVWWPAKTLYGLRPKFGNNYVPEGSIAEFDLVLADMDGKRLAQRGAPVRLIRENRDWYWRYDDQRGWNSGFLESSELISSQSVDLQATGATALKLPVRYGRYRLEVGTAGTPGAAVYRFYAGWSAERDQSAGVRPDRVALKLDKPAYADGDVVHLNVAAPHHGEAIVAVEGDKLLWLKRISIRSDSQDVEIPLDPAWKRQDMYVSVTVLRPGSEGDLVTPTRALGLIHLGLDRSKRKLAVALEAPEKILPETSVPVQIKVPAAKGQQAFVTLSAVDEGILNITSFKTPDPFEAFFGQLRFGAELRDIYGRLIEKMTGVKGKLRWGGDTSLKAPPKTPQKVRLVDLFTGPVQLDAEGNARIALKVPDFNGRLRLMAVAASADQFGSAERSMVVAAPLIAEMNTPRFLAVGDSATLGLDLHNLSGRNQALKVTVSASPGLALVNASQTVQLKNQEKVTLRMNVQAQSELGLADLTLRIEGEHLAMERHFALDVEAPTPPQQVSTSLIVEPGQTVVLKNSDAADWYAGRKSTLMLSTLPPLNAQKVLQGLLHYPYGCAEQTTSTSYPWLFIDEAAAKRYGLPAHSRAEREAVLEKSFAKLGAYQAPNGGFSMWGEGNAHDYWLSAYITHFLQDARAESFNVPAPLYDKAIGYLQAQMAPGIASLPANPLPWSGASNWEHYWNFRNHNFEALAFGAMVLAQDRKVQLSSLRQLFDLRGNANSGLSLVELGIALQLMGDAPRAQTALSEGLAKPRVSGNYWYDYGSDLRDAAQSFVLLHRYKIDVKGDGVLLTQMVEGLKRQPYYSTQDQLAVYLAARVLESYATAEGWSASLGTESGAQALSGTQAQYMPLPQAESTGHSLTNTGKTRLFAVMNSVGNPKQLGEGTPRLLIKRSLFDADGRPLPPSPSLKVGQTVWIEVQTLSDAFTPNALVVDRLPAGLEIENTHLIQGESGGAVSVDGVNPAAAMTDPRVGHVEFRDDRFVAAVRLGNWWGGPLRLFYRARVVTPGRFVLPQSSVEDMYAPQIHAASKGVGVVTVEDARTPVSAPVKSESDSIAPGPVKP